MADLLAGRPRIAVWPSADDGIYVNPQTMQPGEGEVIARRLTEILDVRSKAVMPAPETDG